jgi:DNA mismatch repair protein MutL
VVQPDDSERPRIRRLPPTLIDRIAAGEVVERPASVVKEVVENALDAGAGRVRVEVRDGGATSIAVTDDGCGMTPAEARLALERHATSKLAGEEDLARIGTFGFRGEALPAIASVSRLRLRTRARGAEEGIELVVDGGALVSERAAAGPEGTRVEVADLFAHVPARRKFLKSAATEWGHVAEWLARAALALPEVHFDVWRDGRAAFAWPAVRDPLERIAEVLSEDEAAALVPLERSAGGGVRIAGFASRPDHHRATAAGLHLFVNGRPVRDRLLRHAVLEAYRDWLPRGRYPTALVHVEVPLGAVDVNVHPAKWEVRFADPRALHHAVSEALKDAVAARRWLAPAAAVAPAPGGPAPPATRDRVGAPTGGDWLFAPRAPGAPLAVNASSSGEAEPPVVRFADLAVVGQVLGAYLVVEGKDAVLLVDQHAAHERVLYERLRAQWLAAGVDRQPLLLPETLELEPAAVAALAEHAAAVLELGFEVEPFGASAVVIRAIPALLAGRAAAALVRGLADELRRAAAADAPAAPGARMLPAADRALATLACHAARRAGDALPVAEQRALLDALDSIPWAPTCPHGRPVAVPLERGEIERRFARR